MRNNTVAGCLNKKLPVYRFYIHCTNGFDNYFCEHPQSFVEHFYFWFGTNRASLVSTLPSLNAHLYSCNSSLDKVQAYLICNCFGNACIYFGLCLRVFNLPKLYFKDTSTHFLTPLVKLEIQNLFNYSGTSLRDFVLYAAT